MNPPRATPLSPRAKPDTASEARNAPDKEKDKKNDRGRREG
jgi:hypothetical protein